jgi:hypothetical protein
MSDIGIDHFPKTAAGFGASILYAPGASGMTNRASYAAGFLCGLLTPCLSHSGPFCAHANGPKALFGLNISTYDESRTDPGTAWLKTRDV